MAARPGGCAVDHHAKHAVSANLVTPLLVAGLGGGVVIGPHQTLARRHIEPAVGGYSTSASTGFYLAAVRAGVALVPIALDLTLARFGSASAGTTQLEATRDDMVRSP